MGKQTDRPKRGAANRQAAFWVIAAVVLSLVGISLAGFYARSAPAAEGALPVQISMAGFAPDEIQAQVGQPIQIELINMDDSGHTDGGGWHNFIVERLGVSEKVAPKKRLVFSFTPTEPGEFDFYCDICCGGKENPYMHGRLIVS